MKQHMHNNNEVVPDQTTDFAFITRNALAEAGFTEYGRSGDWEVFKRPIGDSATQSLLLFLQQRDVLICRATSEDRNKWIKLLYQCKPHEVDGKFELLAMQHYL
jgi:hypothetical protein